MKKYTLILLVLFASISARAATRQVAVGSDGALINQGSSGLFTNFFDSNIGLLTNALGAAGYSSGSGSGTTNASGINVAFTPTNYTPTTATSEGNFIGLDSKIGTLLLSAEPDWVISQNADGYNARSKAGSLVSSNSVAGLLRYVIDNSSPRTYGASIQFAADYKSGGTHYPYLFTDTVIVTNSVCISGQGNSATTFAADSSLNGPIIQLGVAGINGTPIFRFSHIRFEGTAGGASNTGVTIVNAYEPNFAFCEFNRFHRAAIEVTNEVFQFWSQIQNCWFVVTNGAGILVSDTPSQALPTRQELAIDACLFSIGGGVAITNSVGFKNIRVSNSRFAWETPFDTDINGIVLKDAEGSQLIGNTFIGFPTNQIPIQFQDSAVVTNLNAVAMGNIATPADSTSGSLYGSVAHVVYVGTNVQGVTLVANDASGGDGYLLGGTNGSMLVADKENGIQAPTFSGDGAALTGLVHDTGDETVAGQKTFSSSPVAASYLGTGTSYFGSLVSTNGLHVRGLLASVGNLLGPATRLIYPQDGGAEYLQVTNPYSIATTYGVGWPTDAGKMLVDTADIDFTGANTHSGAETFTGGLLSDSANQTVHALGNVSGVYSVSQSTNLFSLTATSDTTLTVTDLSASGIRSWVQITYTQDSTGGWTNGTSFTPTSVPNINTNANTVTILTYWTDDNGATWHSWSDYTPASAGTGDVVGPSSSTNSAFALFDGTTGKLLKGTELTPTDVLARANHTGTQPMSTISDAGALATLDTVSSTEIDDDAVTLAKMAAGTAGNLITYDASGNPAAVATGTAGQVLTSNGTGAAPTMQDAAGGFTLDAYRKAPITWDDFNGAQPSATAAVGPFGFILRASGGSVTTGNFGTSDTTENGAWVLSTSATLNNYAEIQGSANDPILFGGATQTLVFNFRLDALNDGTDDYEFAIGFFDTLTATNAVDGAYFLYNSADTEFHIVTRSNSSGPGVNETDNATATTAAAATTYDGKIVIASNASSATFYINDVAETAITTNIPSGSGRRLSLGWYVKKTLGSGNARTMRVGYFGYQPTWAAVR